MKYGLDNDPETAARIKRHEDLRFEREQRRNESKDDRYTHKNRYNRPSANESELERQRRELEEIIRNVENRKG